MDDRPIRILYIDDEPDMIDLVRLILTRKAFEVRGAKNGREGLDAIRQDPPDFTEDGTERGAEGLRDPGGPCPGRPPGGGRDPFGGPGV